MRKKLGKLTALLLSLSFALGMAVPALAAPSSNYHTIVSPKNGDVYYKGENIPVKIQVRDANDPDAYFFETCIEVATCKWIRRCYEENITYTAKIPTQNDPDCVPGTHKLTAYANVACDSEDNDGTGIEFTTPTASVSFKLKALPLPAPSAKPTAKPTAKSVALTWPKVADAQKYEVWRSVKDNKHFVKIKTTAAVSFTDTTAKQGYWYYYYIRSLRDKYGKTIRSVRTPVTKTALTLTAPGKPTGVKAVAGKKQVTVTWKKAALATKYQVWRSAKKSSGFKKVKTTTALKFVDKNVKKGKRYYYRVQAVRVTQVGTKVGPVSAPALSGKVK